jgi:hypothetical protein
MPPSGDTPNELTRYLRQPARWRADAGACCLSPATCADLEPAVAATLASPERRATLARCAAALFGPGEWRADEWRGIPRDDTPAERLFFLLPLLWRLDALRDFYARRGIPDSILRDTLADLPRWIAAFAARHQGAPGLAEVAWLRNHFRGELFALGRLQFQFSTQRAPVAALRQRADGRTVLVATGGSVAASGLFAGSEGTGSEPSRPLAYREEEGEVRLAHPVLPQGRIAAEPLTFAAGAWQRLLAPGDPALALHIPAGAPLDFDSCRESFRQAAAFFPRYFPELPAARAVVCHSWLFYPGLAEILPATANIVRFQLQFMRFPLAGATADQAYERVFPPQGREVRDGDLKTSLQHRLFAHIQAGGVPLIGGGLKLPPFEEWGGAGVK